MRASEQRHLELPARRCSVTSTPTVGQPATQLVVAQQARDVPRVRVRVRARARVRVRIRFRVRV